VKGVDAVHGWPAVIVRTRDGVRFIRIAARKDDPGTAERAGGDAEEIHDFYIQETEVTNGEIRAYARDHDVVVPAIFSQACNALPREVVEQHPAVGIPHDLAERFAESIHGRLPTKAEWDFVASSRGLSDRRYVWPGADGPKPNDDRANIESPHKEGPPTSPVKSHRLDRSDQGVYDLTGNVREWCRDRYRSQELGPERFVVRGGSWRTAADRFEATTRADEYVPADESLDDLGLRVVID
jgi:serine/threonine-protein kinase